MERIHKIYITLALIILIILIIVTTVSFLNGIEEAKKQIKEDQKYDEIKIKGNYQQIEFLKANNSSALGKNVTFYGIVEELSDEYILVYINESGSNKVLLNYSGTEKLKVGDKITVYGTFVGLDLDNGMVLYYPDFKNLKALYGSFNNAEDNLDENAIYLGTTHNSLYPEPSQWYSIVNAQYIRII